MKLTRRNFLKWTLAAGAAGGIAGCSSPPSRPAPLSDGLPVRLLGRTGQAVTILGLGGAYIAGEIDAVQTRRLIEAALEGGVRYFDTSTDYGQSEERLGKVLSPVRDTVFLTTKINGLEAKSAAAELALSLKRLKTSHVDLLLLHGVGLPRTLGRTETILGKGGALEFLQKAKREGLTRFIGMSAHPSHDQALLLLRASDAWDAIMPFVNWLPGVEWQKKTELVKLIRERNLGVVAMKVLGGDGQLAIDYDRTFRYALSMPGVACALIGVRNAVEVKRAIQAARDFRPLTGAELKQIADRGAERFPSGSREVVLLRRHQDRDFGSLDSV